MRPRTLSLVATALLCCSPRAVVRPVSAPKTDVGKIGAASYRIDIPPRWNGGLVMYCHGYRASPAQYDAQTRDEMVETFAPLGYAVAQSGYSSGGYAVAEALDDIEALRLHFTSVYGAPTETWATGQSLGGSLTMMLVEQHPQTYEGGLPMCAPLGPALAYLKTLVFDPLAVFELWFPAVLPSPAQVPADYAMSLERPAQLEKLLDGKPEAAEALRRQTTARTNPELALQLDLFTYVLAELQKRWGANPFDNRDTVYIGWGDDAAVNLGVKRYAADEKAQSAAIRHYTPTGRLERPLLAVRTVYDPIISRFGSDRYAEIAQLAGRAGFFAQQHARGQGHCQISADEVRAAFLELKRWRQTGERPPPGQVPLSTP